MTWLRFSFPLLFGAAVIMYQPDFAFSADDEAKAEETEKADIESEDGEEKDEEGEEGEDVSPFIRHSSLVQELPRDKFQPWQLVRRLQRLQDDIVMGKPDATQAYRVLLVQAANWIDELGDEVWNYERNLDALAVYLFVGGDVQLGYKALQKTELERSSTVFLEAAVAYSERDAETARALLELIDPTSLPLSIQPQYALAKSMVISSKDLAEAKQLISTARRLAPGTLLEEASIRRLIRMAAAGEPEQGMKEIKFLAKTYLVRFPSSHYFTDFLRNVSHGFVTLSDENDDNVVEDFMQLVVQLNPEQQLNVVTYVARVAAVTGRKKLAAWAAQYALDNLVGEGKLRTRLELYSAAASITNVKTTAELMQKIETMRSDDLSENDRKILGAVSAVGQQILREFSEQEIADAAEKRSARKSTKPEDATTKFNPEDVQPAQAARAASLIADVDRLLGLNGKSSISTVE